MNWRKSTSSAWLQKAFQNLREGNFAESLDFAQKALHDQPKDFRALLVAALASGFLDNREKLLGFFSVAYEVNPQSPYSRYLHAYVSLWNNDVEKALWEWTHLAALPEGWLARELIDKARKKMPLYDMAMAGEIANFVILPEISADGLLLADSPAQSESSPPDKKARHSAQELPRRRFVALPVSFFSSARKISLALALSFVLFFPLLWWQKEKLQNLLPGQSNDGGPQKTIENLRIDEWAHVLGQNNSGKTLYEYQNRELLIADFNQAREIIREGKVNQARFLLQRILYSNADFKSKEKSRIFLGFIPDTDYEDFKDNVKMADLLAYPEFYQHCLVLAEVRVLRMKDSDNGKTVSAAIREGNQEYLIEAFLPGEKSSSWLPYSSFEQKSKDKDNPQKMAIAYGYFRGLVGKQKSIYLELKKLWY